MIGVDDAIEIKRLASAAVEMFDGDWRLLEKTLPSGYFIDENERLYRSMSFGDNDYAYCVAEVISGLVDAHPGNLGLIGEYILKNRAAVSAFGM